jgi:hypothetical protein
VWQDVAVIASVRRLSSADRWFGQFVGEPDPPRVLVAGDALLDSAGEIAHQAAWGMARRFRRTSAKVWNPVIVAGNSTGNSTNRKITMGCS